MRKLASIAVLVLGASTTLLAGAQGTGRAGTSPSGPVIDGGQWSQDHYSTLTQINRHNVKKLAVAWIYDTGEPSTGMQTNPVVVDGTVYAYTSSQKVIALNAATGKLLWKFDSGVTGQQPVRGVASGATDTSASSSPAS